jgi:hypothetical protein
MKRASSLRGLAVSQVFLVRTGLLRQNKSDGFLEKLVEVTKTYI